MLKTKITTETITGAMTAAATNNGNRSGDCSLTVDGGGCSRAARGTTPSLPRPVNARCLDYFSSDAAAWHRA